MIQEITGEDGFVCVDYNKVKKELKLSSKLCVHVDEMPKCLLSQKEITQPVIASDGQLYDKASLSTYLAMGNNISFVTRLPFQDISPGHKYKLVRVSCKIKLRSLLHPQKVLKNHNSLVFIARTKNNQDDAVIFVEKRIQHDNPMKCGGGYGQISSYQLRPVDFDSSRKVEIRQQTLTGLAYSEVTQARLFEHYGVDTQQLLARSFISPEPKTKALERAIAEDIVRAEAGSIQYYKYAGKAGIRLWTALWFVTGYNSCNWARSLLHKAHVLQSYAMLYDRNYKLQPIVHRRLVEFLFGATPDRIFPAIENDSQTPVKEASR